MQLMVGSTDHPIGEWLAGCGVSRARLQRKLAKTRVGIAGLGPHATTAAVLLAENGVGTFLLADPYPDPNVGCSSDANPSGPDAAHHGRAARALLGVDSGINIRTFGHAGLHRSNLEALVRCSDLVVGCYGSGFLAAQYWLNDLSVSQGVPALYSDLSGDRALVGPLVLPGATACFTCYRLRTIACASDYTAALAEEGRLAAAQVPARGQGIVAESYSVQAAFDLALEALKLLLSPSACSLRGCIAEYGIDHGAVSQVHPVLKVINCPVCGGSLGPVATPGMKELAGACPEGVQKIDGVERLISEYTGIVRRCGRVIRAGGDRGSVHYYRADLANHSGARRLTEDLSHGFGKDTSGRAAFEGAIGEALEIYGATQKDHTLTVRGRRPQLNLDAVDPRDLVLYRREQYPDLPYREYSDVTTLDWVSGRSLRSGRQVYLPALAVFLKYELRTPEEELFPLGSTGLATGRSLAEAIVFALYEVLERDAFLIAWLNELPCTRTTLTGHPDRGLVDLAAELVAGGSDLTLLKLPTDHACCVYLALSRNSEPDWPAAAVGLGADLDEAAAARKAVLELVQTQDRLTQHLRRRSCRSRVAALCGDLHRVEADIDHGLLYSAPSMAQAFDFLIKGREEDTDWDAAARRCAPMEALRKLVSELAARGYDVFYVNLTPPEIAELSLYTVRVIVPHMQPMHFGRNARRLAGRRLFELPVALGLQPVPKRVGELNDCPHPLG